MSSGSSSPPRLMSASQIIRFSNSHSCLINSFQITPLPSPEFKYKSTQRQLNLPFNNAEPLFSWAPKSLQMVTAAMKLKDTCLLLGRKVMTNLDSILKNRDITLPTKVHLVEAMVFPVVMYGCESWTIKKAEH